MFVNEEYQDGKKHRTIDHERGIILKLSHGSREQGDTFVITVDGNKIPFIATNELLPKNEQGLTPVIWSIESMGWGFFHVPRDPEPGYTSEKRTYKFTSREEKNRSLITSRKPCWFMGHAMDWGGDYSRGAV